MFRPCIPTQKAQSISISITQFLAVLGKKYYLLAFLLLLAGSTYSVTMVASRSAFLKSYGFIMWSVKSKGQKATSCYITHESTTIDTWSIEIGSACKNKQKISSWLNNNSNKNYLKLIKSIKLTKRISDYLFPDAKEIKLKVILNSEKAVLNKRFFYFTKKIIPIVVAIPVYLNKPNDKTVSYSDLAQIIVHEITHIYQHKFLKKKFKKAHVQTQEAIAEIAGICASIYLGSQNLESTSMPSFKEFYKQKLTASESLELTQYGKHIKQNYPRLYNRSIGYVKGLYRLWDHFGISIDSPSQKKKVFKYCKYLINEMPDIDNFHQIKEQYTTLAEISEQ